MADNSYVDPRVTREVLLELLGPVRERDFAVRYWDGSTDEPPGEARFTLVLEHPGSLRRMLVPPSEIRIAEAYIFGDFDIEGNLEAASTLGDRIAKGLRSPGAVASMTAKLSRLPSRDPELSTGRRATALFRHGRQHSKRRDTEAVRFHYDVGNDFYQLWLDPGLVYSCAYFPTGEEDLATAQEAKFEHICRKLRLQPGERMLDIGCGWGGLILHAVKHFDVDATGITLSREQAKLARERIEAAGLQDRCRVEIMDYRDLPGEEAYDKIGSVGMVEHVGEGKLPEYFAAAYRSLKPGGLFLNHGIVSLWAARPVSAIQKLMRKVWRRDVFLHRYVFPDGNLVPATEVIGSAELAGFETRDVESLREHYARTLRIWVARLEGNHTEAAAIVGEPTYRVWRLYMSAAARGFAKAEIGIIQTLLAKPDASGRSYLPPTRADIYA
ncbi:MAG TPA: cyclopropane-fatty-acyl-phospholipid synthase family protein [Longimicrobiaceae bacterium]|nr:cyclopropane-fatty-acyl-phospholipid synthase family protein [Longimicrobiaceae bacterium]